MKKIVKLLFNIACIIGTIVAVWHFFVPYSSEWFSYIPNAPIEIIQSIKYINFCFSFMLAGISLLLIIVQKKLFNGSSELRILNMDKVIKYAIALGVYGMIKIQS